jgi:hypothetical protein
MFRNNQEPNGHVKGCANWLVYTLSMLYAVAKDYLLSQDRRAFEALLPSSLKAMDWCLAEVEKAKGQPGPAAGLVRGPLNDCTGDGCWAFNQAYLFAGLDIFGRALHRCSREGCCLPPLPRTTRRSNIDRGRGRRVFPFGGRATRKGTRA